MAEAIVSVSLELLDSILLPTASFIAKQVRLVGDVDEEVEKLKNNLQAIQAVLLDADQKQMKNKAVRVWLNRLKDACYDVEDVLDEWNTEIMKLKIEGGYAHNALAPKKKVCCFFPSPCFGSKEVVLRRDIAVKITEINKELDAIDKEKDRYNLNVLPANERPDYQSMQTTSFIDVSDICGRDYEKNNLVRKLLCESSEQRLQIISLVGMGGIGKTTLAQYAYNNNEVKSHFNAIMWVCVSNPFDESRIARAIIRSLESSNTPIEGDLQNLLQRIHDSIVGNKFLLILDDVWNEDYNKWEPFYHCLKNDLHGSKILITTRKESVARIMKSIDIINVEELSYEENWELFRRLALLERPTHECEKLEEIGREIVKKCKGLPLATKTIGSLLQFKRSRDEWQRILHSEMWKLEEIENGLLSPLMLSYNDLPSSIRKCFFYCAIFPKDHDIIKDDLIRLWMAQGYLGLEKDTKLETIGEEYFHHLATRSFFQEFSNFKDFIWNCKMHDIVHDFALFLSNGECLAIEVNIGDNNPFINSSNKNVRHLFLKVNKGVLFPMSICSIKSLRSLIMFHDGNALSSDVLQKLCELTCLRSLMFHGFKVVEEIPKEIKKLIHLRYLNLHGQFMVKLPESLCELYNLHTLDINDCRSIVELPQGIDKLVNLRRLRNVWSHGLLYIPKGIAKLTGLQTLSEFVISSEGDNDSKACSLEGLKFLNNLEGSLTIRGLGFVKFASDGKINQVLANKENLTRLNLQFYKRKKGPTVWVEITPGGGVSCEDYELVLEALLPPPKLEMLQIEYYRGNTFPSTWITSLTKLKSLHLWHVSNCKNLHPLGKLPSLERLTFFFMEDVKKVDNVFWGMESGICSSSSSTYFFPKLEELKFWDMKEWGEWDNDNAKKGVDKEHITFMPCLATLDIYNCPKLKALPDSLLQRTALKELNISGCDILRERYKEGTGEDWHKISHIPNIKIDEWVKRQQ
ncbi:disease resistance protein RGA2-like [Pistacia vera]|uniref:disease resistance protein RGA2-like n=1 Tax=Pistacia vera TaxID=55513 RepID=UPI0012633E79|nr:disease resistance protein RGA2-like [Pistacia vera]